MSESTCVKCSGPLAPGFIAERTQGVTHYVAKWVAGEPEQAEIFGIRGANVDVAGRWQFGVRAMRCEKCGFLELYALGPVPN